MRKAFLVILGLFFFLFLARKEVFAETAIDCSGFGANVQNKEGQPIEGASVAVFINNERDFNHGVETINNGDFVYAWPAKGIVYVSITKTGYNSINYNITSCEGNVITMESSVAPTQPPGNQPRCGTGCSSGEQCSLATDGCTLCYNGACIRPENLPTSVPTSTATGDSRRKLCNNDPGCMDCFMKNGVWSAIGCIPSGNLNDFVAWFLSKLIFVASGIAFLLMAFGAFRILTSAGSPEKMQAGKELITSALAGLIFVILSLFLLKLIGVDILQIPGFGK